MKRTAPQKVAFFLACLTVTGCATAAYRGVARRDVGVKGSQDRIQIEETLKCTTTEVDYDGIMLDSFTFGAYYTMGNLIACVGRLGDSTIEFKAGPLGFVAGSLLGSIPIWGLGWINCLYGCGGGEFGQWIENDTNPSEVAASAKAQSPNLPLDRQKIDEQFRDVCVSKYVDAFRSLVQSGIRSFKLNGGREIRVSPREAATRFAEIGRDVGTRICEQRWAAFEPYLDSPLYQPKSF